MSQRSAYRLDDLRRSELEPFSYALVLISVLVGLALGKVASNAHILVWRRDVVAWDSRVVMSATLVVLTIISTWFDLWSIRSVARVLVFGFYLGLIIELLLLYSLAASALPEMAAESDLGQFYARNAGRFWSTFAVFEASYLGLWLSFGGLSRPFWNWSFIIAKIAAARCPRSIATKPLHQTRCSPARSPSPRSWTRYGGGSRPDKNGADDADRGDALLGSGLTTR